MTDTLKNIGTFVLGIVVVLAVFSLPVMFLLGATWAAKNLLKPLIMVGWVFLAFDLLILLPASLIPRARGVTGTVIFISSFIFCLITWLLGFILTYSLWGLWAVILGILLFGGAVVPFAILATFFNGLWQALIALIILLGLTLVSRLVGISVADAKPVVAD